MAIIRQHKILYHILREVSDVVNGRNIEYLHRDNTWTCAPCYYWKIADAQKMLYKYEMEKADFSVSHNVHFDYYDEDSINYWLVKKVLPVEIPECTFLSHGGQWFNGVDSSCRFGSEESAQKALQKYLQLFEKHHSFELHEKLLEDL